MEILICSIPGLTSAEVAALVEGMGAGEDEITVCCTEKELKAALERSRSTAFRFPTAKGIYLLKLSQVCYFSGENHHILAHLEDGTTLVSRTVRISTEEALRPLTDGGQFIRAGRTCFVNANEVELFSHNSLYLRNGEVLPISRSYSARFRRGEWTADGEK